MSLDVLLVFFYLDCGRYEHEVRGMIERQESRLLVNVNDLRYVFKPKGPLNKHLNRKQLPTPYPCPPSSPNASSTNVHCSNGGRQHWGYLTYYQISTLELGLNCDSLQNFLTSSSIFLMIFIGLIYLGSDIWVWMLVQHNLQT